MIARRVFRSLLLVALATAPAALAAGKKKGSLSAEILKITPKRTGLLVDLAGVGDLAEGSRLEADVDGKTLEGVVKKITGNGRALVRLRGKIPASVDVGDTVNLAIIDAAGTGDKVTVARGGYTKAYWDDVSFLANHRHSGLRVDAEIAYVGGVGAEKSKGGRIVDDTEYAVEDKLTTVDLGAGFVGRGGMGGGVLLNYSGSERKTKADIATASTGTVDQDKSERSRKVTDVMPYFAYLSRPKTGDLGFGVGLGVPFRSTKAKRARQIAAGYENDAAPATTSEVGASLEFLAGTDSWAAILVTTPVLSGKIKQAGADDVDHSSSEYGLHFETYGAKLKGRFGLTFLSSDDKYKTMGSLTESGYRISGRLDAALGAVNVVPFLDYTSLSRKRSDASGDATELDLGTRVALSGIYAPFVALGYNLRNEKEKAVDGRSDETKIGGLRLAGGLSI